MSWALLFCVVGSIILCHGLYYFMCSLFLLQEQKDMALGKHTAEERDHGGQKDALMCPCDKEGQWHPGVD